MGIIKSEPKHRFKTIKDCIKSYKRKIVACNSAAKAPEEKKVTTLNLSMFQSKFLKEEEAQGS